MALVPRRSERQLRHASPFESTVDMRRDYTLNIEKALKKKLSQCKKEINIKYEEKRGGNHLFEMSTGMFEAYKYAALQFFEESNHNPKAKNNFCIQHVEDREGHIVESVVRAFKGCKPSHSKVAKPVYTINFYHTTSKILLNGRGAKQYGNDHMEIVNAVRKLPHIESLDSFLVDTITQKLQTMTGTVRGTAKRGSLVGARVDAGVAHRGDSPCSQNQQSSTTLESELDNEGDITSLCTRCDRVVAEDSIECSQCGGWVHWRCELMTEQQFLTHVDDPHSRYCCLNCRSVGLGGEGVGDAGGVVDQPDGAMSKGSSSVYTEMQRLGDHLDTENSAFSDDGLINAKDHREAEQYAKSSYTDFGLAGAGRGVDQPDGAMNRESCSTEIQKLGDHLNTVNSAFSDNGPINARDHKEAERYTKSSYIDFSLGSPIHNTENSEYHGNETNSVAPEDTQTDDVHAVSVVANANSTDIVEKTKEVTQPNIIKTLDKTEYKKKQPKRCTPVNKNNSETSDLGPNTTVVDAASDTLCEQILKSKEKLLNKKESKLKETEKRLHLKEISLTDQIEQSEFSKAYIITMENKMKELEKSNRLLRMKVLTQDERESDPIITNNKPNLPENLLCNGQGSIDLQARITNIEMKLLESRIEKLEKSLGDNANPNSHPTHGGSRCHCPHLASCAGSVNLEIYAQHHPFPYNSQGQQSSQLYNYTGQQPHTLSYPYHQYPRRSGGSDPEHYAQQQPNSYIYEPLYGQPYMEQPYTFSPDGITHHVSYNQQRVSPYGCSVLPFGGNCNQQQSMQHTVNQFENSAGPQSHQQATPLSQFSSGGTCESESVVSGIPMENHSSTQGTHNYEVLTNMGNSRNNSDVISNTTSNRNNSKALPNTTNNNNIEIPLNTTTHRELCGVSGGWGAGDQHLEKHVDHGEKKEDNLRQHPIPVHFSCRGRRKTARYKQSQGSMCREGTEHLEETKTRRLILGRGPLPRKVPTPISQGTLTKRDYPSLLLITAENRKMDPEPKGEKMSKPLIQEIEPPTEL